MVESSPPFQLRGTNNPPLPRPRFTLILLLEQRVAPRMTRAMCFMVTTPLSTIPLLFRVAAENQGYPIQNSNPKNAFLFSFPICFLISRNVDHRSPLPSPLPSFFNLNRINRINRINTFAWTSRKKRALKNYNRCKLKDEKGEKNLTWKKGYVRKKSRARARFRFGRLTKSVEEDGGWSVETNAN